MAGLSAVLGRQNGGVDDIGGDLATAQGERIDGASIGPGAERQEAPEHERPEPYQGSAGRKRRRRPRHGGDAAATALKQGERRKARP